MAENIQDSEQIYTKLGRLPHLNIGTLGHVDHGKTTFTAAITYVFSKVFPSAENKTCSYDQIDKSPEERARGITIKSTTVQYVTLWQQAAQQNLISDELKAQTANFTGRHFSHVDCPGHQDYIKNMITGASQMDAAILIISAVDGIMPQTKEHILLASKVGVKRIILFINKEDIGDPELIELILSEAVEELEKHGFPTSNPGADVDPNSVLIVGQGSATAALKGEKVYMDKIVKLFADIDTYIPTPPRIVDAPFFFPVEAVHSIAGRGTVVTGCIERGTIKVNEEIEIVGRDDKSGVSIIKKAVVTGVEAFKKSLEVGLAGDNVGILLRGVTKDDVERGMFLVKPGSVKLANNMKISLLLLTKAEGGRHKSITTGYRPQIYYGTGNYATTITLLKVNGEDVGEGAVAMPGDYIEISASLDKKIPLAVGEGIAIREGGLTIGSGKISEVIF